MFEIRRSFRISLAQKLKTESGRFGALRCAAGRPSAPTNMTFSHVCKQVLLSNLLALEKPESGRFELPRAVSHPNGLANRRLRPLGQLSISKEK